MTERIKRKFDLRIIPGILISMGALIVLINFIDTEKVLQAFRTISLKVLIPAGLIVILSLVTRAFAWRILLQKRITIGQSFLIINAGYFVNTVLPFRLGEISRAFLVVPSGINFWEGLPAIFLERLFDVGFALALLFISLPYALGFSNDLYGSYVIAALGILIVILLYLGVNNRERILTWLKNISWLNDRIKAKAVQFTESIITSLEILKNPARLLEVFVGMGLSWALALVFQFILLRAFIPEVRLVWAAFVLGAVAVGVSVPSSPGNIGLYEGSITLALSAFGVDPSLAFTYALTSHIINLGITTGFGAYGLVRVGVGLRDVWQFGKQKKEGEEL